MSTKNSLTQLPLFSDYQQQGKDNRPLPLIIADKWQFPLTHIEDIDKYLARDWYMGLGGDKGNWSKQKGDWLYSLQPVMIEVKRERRKPEMMEFVDAYGLYSIAARMTPRKDTPQLEQVKDYLAKAGVKLDDYRINPENAVTDVISDYQQQGKDNQWIAERLKGIDARKTLTNAIKGAIEDMPVNMYTQTTEKLYKGLWERTTAILRQDLNMPPKGGNVRDHFGTYALIYTGLAERVAGDLITQAGDLTPGIVMDIVWKVAVMIKQQADATSEFLGRDLVTDKPLLRSGK